MAETPIEDFLASYPDDTSVRFEAADMVMPLSSALAMEHAFCQAKPEKRDDPIRRLGYLATVLDAAGSLLPEHKHLLPKPEI